MKYGRNIAKEDQLRIEEFKKASDQSAMKGRLISLLIKTLGEERDYFGKKVLMDALEELQKKGDIKLTKENKKKLLEVIDREIDEIKSHPRTLKREGEFLAKIVHQMDIFYKKYSNPKMFFDPNSDFFWRGKGFSNFEKAVYLRGALETFDFDQLQKHMGRLQVIVAIDKKFSEFLKSVSEAKEARESLLNGSPDVKGIIFIMALRSKSNSHKEIEELKSKSYAALYNRWLKEMVDGCKKGISLWAEVKDKLHGLVWDRQKEIKRLNEERKRIKLSPTIKTFRVPEKEKGKPRVLVLTHEIERGGGVATVTRKVAENLNKEGKLISDVISHSPPRDMHEIKPYSFYYKGKTSRRIDFDNLNDLLIFLAEFNYSIIHIHSLSFASALRGGLNQIKAINPSSKLIYTCHSVVAHERFVQGKNRPWGTLDIEAQEELLEKADKIVHLTNFGAIIAHGNWKEFLSATGVKKNSYYPQYRSKAVIIPNGIDIKYGFFNRFGQPLHKKVNKGKTVNLTFVGRLAEEKGVLSLSKIFPSIAAEFPNLRLVFVGKEHGGSGIEKLMKFNLKAVIDKVDFKGWKEGLELEAEYKSSDIVIIPSFNESFSIVTLDAFSYGKPVIISNVDGPKELFVESTPPSAIGIDPQDPKTILTAVKYYMSQPKEAEKRTKLGREKIIEVYNWARITKEYEKLYRSVSNGSVFVGEFGEPEEKVPELPDTTKKVTNVGFFYDNEFWSSFIHLLDKKGYIVDTWGTGFHKKSLEQFMRDNDVIISACVGADKWKIIVNACKKHKKPLILRYGGGIGMKQDNISKESFRQSLREANVLAPTDLLSAEILQEVGISKNRQVVIPNPVELDVIDSISTNKTELKERFDLPKNKLVIGFIGRMDPMRHVLYLVEAYRQYCNYLKETKQRNNLCLFMLGKLMEDYKLPSNYLPGIKGKFGQVMEKEVTNIMEHYGGKNRGNTHSNEGLFGKDNLIYEPLSHNIKHNIYLSLLAACDYVSILPGFGVGSNRAMAETLALKRRVLTLNAVTNAFAYGPVADIVPRQPNLIRIKNFKTFLPDLNAIVEFLKHLNKNYNSFMKPYTEGRAYIEMTMGAKFLTEERLIPTIDLLLKTYNGNTGNFDHSEIEKMYGDALSIMGSKKYDPRKEL